MPAFEPGHAYHPPRTDVIGARAPARAAQRALAALIDEVVDFRVLITKLQELALGRNPSTGEAVDATLQHAAMRTLLERRYGVPTQDIRIEAQLQAVVAIGQASAFAAIDALPQEDLLQLERTLARLGITAPGDDAEQPQP